MIQLIHGESLAEFVPGRGAICSRLRLGGSEILFMDPATLADPAKNVRGGIPVLFPVAGKPAQGPQHGFARTLPWEAQREGADRLTCMLVHDGVTAQLAYALDDTSLRIEFALLNQRDQPYPFHLGYHPYFLTPDKAQARVETQATKAFDNTKGTTGPVPALDFTQGELDLHLLDHGQSGTVLHRGPLPPVTLRWSPEFRVMVLWTLPGREFVCVEPWTGRPDAPKLAADPGQTVRLQFSISCP
jgi:galactose mutarotase-like enzyme